LERVIPTLENLGLTGVQAKVYFALSKIEALTISEISEISKIHRTDLYEILPNLEKKGLVEREISQPMRYRAVPIKEGLDVLLRKKSRKYSELQNQVANLKKALKEPQKRKSKTNQKSKFILISKNRIIECIEKSIDKTKESIDLILSQPRFSKGIVLFAEKIDKSCSRGVRWRFITEKPHLERPFLDQIEELRKKPHCQVRFLTSVPHTILGIYDRKEVFIFKNPTESINMSPALWSDNPSLISIVTDYFDLFWLTALEDEFQKTTD
jgi:sugar-specific transcriptional regulator TrmB